jgi:TP901 family phage tail tape measure protein
VAGRETNLQIRIGSSLDGRGFKSAEASARILERELAKLELQQRKMAAEELAAYREQESRAKAVADREKQLADRRNAALGKVGSAAIGAGLALGVGVGFAVKQFADFDKAMSRAAAGTDATEKEMGQLRSAAIRAGADTQFSAVGAADAITALGKAGVSVQDILGGGLAGSLSLAAAGELDVGQAAEIAATAMTQFGLQGKELPHVADLLAAGAGKAQGDVTDLSLALSYVGPVAHGMGISIEEATGTIAELASQGILGEKAGTGLRGVLSSLTSPSAKAAAEMKSLGIEVYDAQGNFKGFDGVAGELRGALSGMTAAQRDAALGVIFGNEQITTARVLYQGGAEAVDEWTRKVNDSGFATRQAARLMDNLSGDAEKLRGSLQTAFISGGSGANDGLRSLVQTADHAVDLFNDLPPELQQGAVQMAALAAATLLAAGAATKAVIGYANLRRTLTELGASASLAQRALLTVTIAGTAGVIGAGIGEQIGHMQAADVQTRKLSASLVDFARSGKLGRDGLKLFDDGVGPFKNHADSTAEALHRFGAEAHLALDSGWNARLGRWQSLGGGVSKFRDTVGQLDAALADMVKHGRADEARTAFERLTKAAVDQGLPFAKIQAEFKQYSAVLDGVDKSGNTAADRIENLNLGLDANANAAQRAAAKMEAYSKEVAATAEKSFGSQTDVLGGFQVDDGAASKSASESLAKAKQRLADVEARVAVKRKRTLSDEQAITRAQQAVARAQRGVTEATALSATKTLSVQYRDTLREAQQFTRDITEVTRRGLDPGTVSKLLQEGPHAAEPVLQALLSDHSNRLIAMSNRTEQELAKVGATAVEQARLTARAIASDSSALSDELPRAMQIARVKAELGARDTATAIARALHIPPAEVQKIADDFGILLASDLQVTADALSPIFQRADALMARNGQALDGNTAAAAANRKGLDDLRTSAGNYLAQVEQQLGPGAAFQGVLAATRARLEDEAVKFGMGKDAAKRYADQILAVPKLAQTTLQLEHAQYTAQLKAAQRLLASIRSKNVTIHFTAAGLVEVGKQSAAAAQSRFQGADGGVMSYYAAGGVTIPMGHRGDTAHTAQIAPAGAMRVWAEPETGGEAYIPLAPAKRRRSKSVAQDVVERFGGRIVWMAAGGVTRPVETPQHDGVRLAPWPGGPQASIPERRRPPVPILLPQQSGPARDRIETRLTDVVRDLGRRDTHRDMESHRREDSRAEHRERREDRRAEYRDRVTDRRTDYRDRVTDRRTHHRDRVTDHRLDRHHRVLIDRGERQVERVTERQLSQSVARPAVGSTPSVQFVPVPITVREHVDNSVSLHGVQITAPTPAALRNFERGRSFTPTSGSR